MGPPSGENSQGHISQVSDSRKNEIAESIFGLSYWCLIGLGWYWMLSDEGRLGVCKITSSVVSPLALSLPLLDSSALPQTLPRTFYSLFIFLPTLRLLSSHIRHNSLFSLNPFLYFHFTLQMMLELKNFLLFEYFLHIYSQYLFHIITHMPIIKTAVTFRGQVGSLAW